MLDHPANDHDTLPPTQDPEAASGVQEPPRTWLGTVKYLGPGLIIAGSIVGSGELIGTTKTGAQAGMTLLWLIITGCLIKVFVQIELGRYTITHGQSTLSALDEVPGPRFGVNWIVWYWVLMMLASVGQLGGIVGGVGQAVAIAFPLTGDYVRAVQIPHANDFERYLAWDQDLKGDRSRFQELSAIEQSRVEASQKRFEQSLAALGSEGDRLLTLAREGQYPGDLRTRDDKIWATLIGIATAFILYAGRYQLIQNASTVMVCTFTLITIGNVIALQSTTQWSISGEEFLSGLTFSLPPTVADKNSLHTALATFGIIGVGATELIAYPYWCLEKGYARFAGVRSESPAWAERARGWVRVMKIDAVASMVVYTLATLAFYIMGVAVLHREGLDPAGMRMVSTLAQAYAPVFGEYARWLFLIGAFAVLYSTYVIACAGHARTWVDAFKLFRLLPLHNQSLHDRALQIISFVFPLLCLGVFLIGQDPVTLVLLSGIMQAVMLPMLAGATLYFRRTGTDPRLKPSRLWDAMLVISAVGMLVAGLWGAYSQIAPYLVRS